MATRKANTDPEIIEEPQDMEQTLAQLQEQNRKLQEELARTQQRSGGRQDDAAIVRKAAQEAAEAGKDPFDVVVNIRIPRRGGREDPWYWLNVNGRSCQVPADDQYHEMKLPWAETLINALEAERKADAFQDSLEVYDPITNPKRD